MKKILIAPLDWGLGHATRCIPLVQELLKRKCEVFLGGSGDSLTLLKQEFPELKSFCLPGYQPVYPSAANMVWTMALQVPKFLSVIKKEHDAIESLISTHQIDFVISDNRYGCWSEKIPSVILTHQLNILMPNGFGWLSGFVDRLNRKLIGKFSQCWVPDYEDQHLSISGKLSAPRIPFKHVSFVGPLSRFKPMHDCEHKYDVSCICSGPEPQRSVFEKKIKEQLKDSGLRYFVVRGNLSQKNGLAENEADLLNSNALQTVICQSSIVITRSGYSTIMDLASLGKKGIFVPTPGQTEQEYLASRWSHRGSFFSMTQRDFNLTTALRESASYTGLTMNRNHAEQLLKRALDQFLNQTRK